MLSSRIDDRFHQLPFQLMDLLYHFHLPPETVGIQLDSLKALRPMTIIADVIDFLEDHRVAPKIDTGLMFSRPSLLHGGFFPAKEVLDQYDQIAAARCRELGKEYLLDRLPHYWLPTGSGTTVYCYYSHLHAVAFPALDDMEE